MCFHEWGSPKWFVYFMEYAKCIIWLDHHFRRLMDTVYYISIWIGYEKLMDY